MKKWKLFNEGDKVEITYSTISEDIGKTGIIKTVRKSFCIIDTGDKTRNYTYAMFKKI